MRGRWLKHTYPDSLPLPERDPPPDNRWQRGDVVDALYLADTDDTVWAEWYRHLAEQGVPPLAQMPGTSGSGRSTSRWPTSPPRSVSPPSVYPHHDRGSEPGPPFSASARSSGKTAGRDCSHRAPRTSRARSSACSAMRMAFAGPNLWGSLAGLQSRPHRLPACRPEVAAKRRIRGPICGSRNRQPSCLSRGG